MTWPAAATKAFLDQATDDPKQARTELADLIDKFNQLQAHVSSFMQGLLDDADAATGRTTLGLGTAAVKNTGTSGDALPLLNASADFSNAFLLSGTISPSQITANQNNYNPSGLAGATRLRLTTDAARTITGLQGGAAGRMIGIANVGSNNLTLASESASSTASNRFLFAGGDLTLAQNQSVFLWYDNTTGRWRRATETQSQSAFTRGTLDSSTGGSHDHTGIGANARVVKVMLDVISLNGSDPLLIRLGDSSGYENTGYTSTAWELDASPTNDTDTTGFVIGAATGPGLTWTGEVELTNITGNKWICSGRCARATGEISISSGIKETTGVVDRVQITAAVNTIDAGSSNILWG